MVESSMTETEFLERAEAEMLHLQDLVESRYEDVDCMRSGNVLTMETDDGAQVVANIQTPMREIWLASHAAGGMHFELTAKGWINPRNGNSLEDATVQAIEALL